MTLAWAAENAALVFAMMTLLWVASVALRDVSIVDPWWSIAFVVVTVNSARHTGLTPAKALLVALVIAWGTRLWLHLLVRSHGKPEDPRYAGFRARFGADRYWWVSFFQVFLLQGTLALLISTPLQLAAASTVRREIGPVTLAGLALFAIGFAFEAVADWQLHRFRTAVRRDKTVLDTGLWRYSRHPNYFGETVLWWGFWLMALPEPFGWATVAAPMLMTFLLLRVSGVTMLDAHLTATRPGYADYLRRTSAFFPRTPLG